MWKHANGYLFEKGESTLFAFSRQTGDIQLADVKSEDILGFLNGTPVSTITWRLKYWTLCRFFEHWFSRGAMPELALPTPRPFVRQTFVPYVFTKLELRSLLEATAQNQKLIIRIDGATLRTIILFLYGTGASVGESTRVLQSDVDLQKGFIRIRSPHSHRSRYIPIGQDLVDVLRQYVAWRSQIRGPSQHLFVTKKGRQVCAEKIAKNFKRLRTIAGIHRRDGSRYQPRVSDLRFTFAVHRITKWIEDGVDLNRMLPALAAYMGQVGLGSTERYLSMTPERFRKDLDKLSPMRGRGQWSNDPELMRFLTSL
ncbi:tyrosine-type recombinase/integrase [Edaphobacter acidisoli]|nr:tyrosine-type recombinase/integrase [Edaphobacter acidisoli]